MVVEYHDWGLLNFCYQLRKFLLGLILGHLLLLLLCHLLLALLNLSLYYRLLNLFRALPPIVGALSVGMAVSSMLSVLRLWPGTCIPSSADLREALPHIGADLALVNSEHQGIEYRWYVVALNLVTPVRRCYLHLL